MARLEKKATETRANLIKVAGKLFAKQGYDSVSVREICKSANANIASIHYYFGDKQGLYEDVLKYTFFSGLEIFPDPDRRSLSTPEAYLEEVVFTVLSRIHRTRKTEWHAKLIRREMLFPSVTFKKVIGKIIQNDYEIFYNVLKEINPNALEDDIKNAIICVSGQIGAYTFHPEDFLDLCFPGLKFSEENCRRIARSITHYVVSGFKSLSLVP